MMWILKRQFADKDPQAHSRRTESETVHSQHHTRQWQGNYGFDRVMSTRGIDPFEQKQREVETELENYYGRNGHPRGYDSPSRGPRSTGFDRVGSYGGGPPPWLSFAELMQWQRDHGNTSQERGLNHRSRR